MTTTIDEAYEGAGNGVSMSTGNTGFGNITSPANTTGVFDTSYKHRGSSSGKLTTGTGAAAPPICRVPSFASVQAQSAIRTYIRTPGTSSANNYNPSASQFILQAQKAGAVRVGDVRINTNGTITVRNLNTAVASSSTVLKELSEYRLEWRIDSTNSLQYLDIYAPGNTDGTTPDETISGTYNQGSVDNYGISCCFTTQDNMQMNFDDTKVVDSSSAVGPSQTPAAQTVTINWQLQVG